MSIKRIIWDIFFFEKELASYIFDEFLTNFEKFQHLKLLFHAIYAYF